jgi:branched-chain amino acid transport system permease protein
MEVFLQQLLSGIAIGSIYALVALSLVITRLATGHINFAQGEMAMFSAYIAWWLISLQIPIIISVAITMILSFMVGMLIEYIIIRRCTSEQNDFSLLIVFIGLFLFFHGAAGFIFGTDIIYFPSIFPTLNALQNSYISTHELGTILLTIVIMFSLKLFFSKTNTGFSMRAIASNAALSRLCGIRVDYLKSLAWGMAAATSAIAGILIAPITYLDPNMMEGILLYALAGLIFGGIDNPLGAVLGGFFIGIIENLLSTYVSFIGHELKLPLAFAIIVLVLYFKPTGLLGKKIINRV